MLKKSKCRDVPIENGFRGLRRIDLDEGGWASGTKTSRPGARQADVILHDRIVAGKPVFDPQLFENPLRRLPLLRRRRLSGLENRVDDRNQRPGCTGDTWTSDIVDAASFCF